MFKIRLVQRTTSVVARRMRRTVQDTDTANIFSAILFFFAQNFYFKQIVNFNLSYSNEIRPLSVCFIRVLKPQRKYIICFEFYHVCALRTQHTK